MSRERSGSFTLAAAVCSLAVPTTGSCDLHAPHKSAPASLEPRCSWPAPATAAPTNSEAEQTAAPPAPRRPVSVVVGAGPAGILSAVYLARRGHAVHIYDRRPSPLEVDSSDDTRAFVVVLHSRGLRALEGAGFDVPALATAPAPGGGASAGAAGPASGLQVFRGLAFGRDGSRVQRTAGLSLAGPRQAFVCGMVAQAQRMAFPAGGSLTWHWGAAFVGADLAAKTATFEAEPAAPASCIKPAGSAISSSTGSSSASPASTDDSHSSSGGSGGGAPAVHQRHIRAYDLLVAADGGWSRVRRAAQKQMPQLKVSTELSTASYKVFKGLPPSPTFPLDRGLLHSATAATDGTIPTTSSTGTATTGSPGSAAAGTAAANPATAADTSSAAAGAAGDAGDVQLRAMFASGRALFVGCDPRDGTARGVVSMPTPEWQGLAVPADYEAQLKRHFPALPEEWVPLIADQLAERPLAVAGMRVHASQLHGPSLLLVGDAGHGVTPRTGNGMNAAMEDAWLLDQLLGQSGGDLSTLPERFTSARLADAHALLWLDRTAPARNGSSPWGLAHPVALISTASLLARSFLTRATQGWVSQPAAMAMNSSCVPYSQVKGQIQRDGALVAAAVVGGVATVAAACLRRR